MILLLLFSLSAQAAPSQLSLTDYLAEVSNRSPNVSAARLHADGGASRAQGANVPTAPYLFGSLNALDDQAVQAYPAFQGTETISNSYTVGVGLNSAYGIDGRYSWNTGYMNVNGVSFPTAGNYTSFNKVELTWNLLRNGFGSEIAANQQLVRSNSQAQSLSGDFQLVGALSQAESAYWRLGFARQAVAVQKDVLDRAEKLLEWAKRRVNLQLGDKSDLLQAQANFGLHRTDLSTAIEEEHAAARAFNILRDKEDDSVPEAVAVPSVPETLHAPPPRRESERLDVQAAVERTKAAQAQTQLEKEKIKPNLDLNASYAWNGRDRLRGDSVSDALGGQHPTKSIAVSFSVPLDVATLLTANGGANKEIEAATFDLDQTRLAEAKDWNDLSEHLVQSRARLELLNTLETVQKEKYENERQRLLRGRTTTYQTITFEQDYANTQLQRLNTQADVLKTIAQMKSFRGKP
jgi:outer membrane protein TolC